jgi:small GTP-binding protein
MTEEQKIEITSLPSETTGEFNFKIVIIGEPGVGKSSIISRGVNNIFTNDYKATLCFDHSWKNYKVNNTKIRIQLWDTCGQEIYHSVIKNFYKSALCIFVVFSIDNNESFDQLSFWLNEIRDTCSEDILIFLIGNKKDKENERVVSKEKIDNFIQLNNIVNYFETSAANGENIDKLFEETVKELYIRNVIPCINGFYSRNSSDLTNTIEKTHLVYSDTGKGCKNCIC